MLTANPMEIVERCNAVFHFRRSTADDRVQVEQLFLSVRHVQRPRLEEEKKRIDQRRDEMSLLLIQLPFSNHTN